MDFPLFHLDYAGNRMLIAFIAVVHVIVNHPMAVGAMPLVTLMEWWGWRRGDVRWDELARRILFACFIITTTVGALTGVGIWLSASLANPYAIGSLIRVFFWGWFTEWIIFCLEVGFILFYFLTWKTWSGKRKLMHIRIGLALSIFSWLTMAIIVAILGFMMDTGAWLENPSLIDGVLNPIYLPQLAFRTPFAMALAGLFALFLIFFFTKNNRKLRHRAVRFVSLWTLAWTPIYLLGAWWYWKSIPPNMIDNIPVALATQAFESWHTLVAWFIVFAVTVIVLVALWGVLTPKHLPRVALIVPMILCVILVGYFERVREFIRKPYVIEKYMYANGILVQDYPLLARDGVLQHASYTPVREITEENKIEAGRAMFVIACTRCHTVEGLNGVVDKLSSRFGNEPWPHEAVKNFLAKMHNSLTFMPPVPGTEKELDALTAYMLMLQTKPEHLRGAQDIGVDVPVDAAQDSTKPKEEQNVWQAMIAELQSP